MRRTGTGIGIAPLGALALALLLAGGPAAGQQEPPVPFETALSASGVLPGGEITLAGLYDVPPDHHITDKSFGLLYLEPELPEGVAIADTIWPEPTAIEKGEEVYRGLVVLKLVLAADPSVVPGDYDVPYAYGYQVCREPEPEMCFLPNGGSGSFTLTVLEPGATPIPSGRDVFGGGGGAAAGVEMEEGAAKAEQAAGGGSALEDRLGRALERGSVAAFLLVFVAGILISFTPCVYPMIPIIIGFVGGSAGGSRVKGFVLSLFFVLGLAVVYAILGVIAAATGALFGAYMQNPVVLWFIVGVFLLLGASMLGAFDISVPASVQAKLDTGGKGGILGAILIGGVTGIVAAPCAGPPLLVLLSWIGNTGNVVLGFFLMATFALGIGVLFVVIGTFAGAMTALPQAGPWMETIKKALGWVIFGVALYYLNLLVGENLFHLLLAVYLVLFGGFLGAWAKGDELTTGAKKYGKGVGLLLVAAAVFYLVLGLAGLQGVSLAGGAALGSAGDREAVAEEHVPWMVNEHDAAFTEAAEQGRPVLIDFYADWCGVCVELDHKVWNQPEVIEAVERDYVPLKLDYTRATGELEALRAAYGVGGLPTVMVVSPAGDERARFTTFMEPEEVVAWLDENA